MPRCIVGLQMASSGGSGRAASGPTGALELDLPVCDGDVAVLDVQLQWPREGRGGEQPFSSSMHADAHPVQSVQ